MKIFQIFDHTTPMISGYSMRSRYISENLKKLGIDVTVFRSPLYDYDPQKEVINDVSYISGDSIAKQTFLGKLPILKRYMFLRAYEKLVASCWDPEVKLIDAHSSPMNGVVASKLSKRFNCPFFYQIRAFWEDAAVDQGKAKEGDLRYILTRNMETGIMRKADRVSVICEGLKKDIINRGIDGDKIFVIKNGVDSDKFQPQPVSVELQEKYNLKDKIVIGFIGSFFLFEGLDYLVKAAHEMRDMDNVVFLIVGAGRQAQQIASMVKDLNLENKVILTGNVPHDDVMKYYSVIDVCVYPRISKRITELVTPLKPLEAMALEKVVLGSDVGGIKELVKDQENGYLFKAGDLSDLVSKLKHLVTNFDQVKSIGKQAREYVIKERNWQTICQTYLRVFEEMGLNK